MRYFAFPKRSYCWENGIDLYSKLLIFMLFVGTPHRKSLQTNSIVLMDGVNCQLKIFNL